MLTAAFMFIGGILLTASNGPTIQGWAIMFAVAQVCAFTCSLPSNCWSWPPVLTLSIFESA